MTTPRAPRPMLPKLTIPEHNFVPGIESQVWVPNPLTSKLTSVFAAPTIDPPNSAASIYCSQCKRFYANPAVFFNHIYSCN
ncbi:hypothetical protein GGI25_005633 [Coemansia spiralis]|uniref:Uncharacterized protein n=2 Tax=Coemansia TaxID=4863 RepID=A0A9W8G299_9FUNG|nr:hypothetical protein EDC05_005698 [Coemansia umbellata]KAJ2619424.1 hypothetical protein GGI26_005850 [Coemansia sp. RSA 1358]KAJ2671018.1 hypothetical protein GGI25_005633 [Coemansia spiralis]